MDAETVAFLDLCATRAGVTSITPVEQVARFALACMNGLVLRWLVDRDSDAALIALDDLVQTITTRRAELASLPGSSTPPRKPGSGRDEV